MSIMKYMKNYLLLGLFISTLGFAFCTIDETTVDVQSESSSENSTSDQKFLIDTSGMTIAERFEPPTGFKRIETKDDSFGAFLRSLPLKPHGSLVKYYNGEVKRNNSVYCGVVDLEIGKRDLHQCADAIMRLRADYLRMQKRFDEIQFTFNTGFVANYGKWKKGYRIHFTGQKFYWTKDTQPSDSEASYWKYLEYVFSFAGTHSLAQELPAVDESEMQIGDIFLWGGHPGHGVIIVDMAMNEETGEKCFMLAQSYMPAQEIQILINPNDSEMSPWYPQDFGEFLLTPEWRFEKGFLKRF